MLIKKDIDTEEDIACLVHRFYEKVKVDPLLSPIFNRAIKGSWDGHLQIMCNFWSTILLYSRKYVNDPISKHFSLAIEQEHFTQWLYVFKQTVDELFEGTIANEAKKRATAIASLMKYSIKENNDEK